eukprot:TRINITY_DN2161_c0_g1_i1.p1 TRINITY_DN2161_c0_g1~~TRINITY_DN2161_c0_g1_i1.p1  ORF type:complete len:594 (-),score=140.82 TRINITY_DN2161_c0_g1_i1:81-1862(-)
MKDNPNSISLNNYGRGSSPSLQVRSNFMNEKTTKNLAIIQDVNSIVSQGETVYFEIVSLFQENRINEALDTVKNQIYHGKNAIFRPLFINLHKFLKSNIEVGSKRKSVDYSLSFTTDTLIPVHILDHFKSMITKKSKNTFESKQHSRLRSFRGSILGGEAIRTPRRDMAKKKAPIDRPTENTINRSKFDKSAHNCQKFVDSKYIKVIVRGDDDEMRVSTSRSAKHVSHRIQRNKESLNLNPSAPFNIHKLPKLDKNALFREDVSCFLTSQRKGTVLSSIEDFELEYPRDRYQTVNNVEFPLICSAEYNSAILIKEKKLKLSDELFAEINQSVVLEKNETEQSNDSKKYNFARIRNDLRSPGLTSIHNVCEELGFDFTDSYISKSAFVPYEQSSLHYECDETNLIKTPAPLNVIPNTPRSYRVPIPNPNTISKYLQYDVKTPMITPQRLSNQLKSILKGAFKTPGTITSKHINFGVTKREKDLMDDFNQHARLNESGFKKALVAIPTPKKLKSIIDSPFIATKRKVSMRTNNIISDEEVMKKANGIFISNKLLNKPDEIKKIFEQNLDENKELELSEIPHMSDSVDFVEGRKLF